MTCPPTATSTRICTRASRCCWRGSPRSTLSQKIPEGFREFVPPLLEILPEPVAGGGAREQAREALGRGFVCERDGLFHIGRFEHVHARATLEHFFAAFGKEHDVLHAERTHFFFELREIVPAVVAAEKNRADIRDRPKRRDGGFGRR